MNVLINLDISYDAGPFDLYESSDGIGYFSFDTSVPASSLTGNTYIASLNDVSLFVKAVSTTNCTNEYVMNIQPSNVC